MTETARALASSILAFSSATHASRSAAVAALKVCLCPLEVKKNLLAPSVLGSEASAWKDGVRCEPSSQERILNAYQLDGTLGSGLVLLTEKEETLASLGSPGLDVVGDVGNLVGLERGERLEVDGLGAEPEELLGVDEVPLKILVSV